MRRFSFILVTALLAACNKQPDAAPTTTPEPTSEPTAKHTTDGDAGTSDRPKLTAAECEAQGGKAVGDIGDGAIHRPDYKCESGEPPVGTITPDAGGPVAVEGSVCCK